MNARDPKLYIEDIITSMEKIERYIKDITKEVFENDDLKIDAVIRNLEIIGEAARNVPEEIKTASETIPWGKMIGLRNITIHEYFGVDTDIIWEIITKNLPQTKQVIMELL